MKILIIAHHRSGSTVLMRSLFHGIKNSIEICEPFKNKNPNTISNHIAFLNNSTNNVIEKHLITQPTKNYNDNILFFKEYMLNFNKVIILLRNNQIETAKSQYYLVKHMAEGVSVHSPYTIKENLDLSQDLTSVKNYHKSLYNLSSITKIPITFYEDLYSGNKEYINYFLKTQDIQINNFNLFCEYLNPKNRYRQN